MHLIPHTSAIDYKAGVTLSRIIRACEPRAIVEGRNAARAVQEHRTELTLFLIRGLNATVVLCDGLTDGGFEWN